MQVNQLKERNLELSQELEERTKEDEAVIKRLEAQVCHLNDQIRQAVESGEVYNLE